MDEGADWAFEGQVLDEEGSALSHLGSQDLVDDEPKARSGIAPEIWAAYNAGAPVAQVSTSRSSRSIDSPAGEGTFGGLDVQGTLEKRFGLSALKPWQRDAIDAILAGPKRALVIAPTGGGKSLTYQLPATVLPGTSVIVSPLVALMDDQVRALEARGIPATYLASTLTADERRARLDRLASGQVKLVYVAPERLANPSALEALARLRPPLVAIDEAHCISQWGHDFRPDYLRLAEVLERLAPQHAVACTATATPRVRAEILEKLRWSEASTKVVLKGFARPNLHLAATEVDGVRGRRVLAMAAIKEAIGGPKGVLDGAAILYASTRKSAEEAAALAAEAGYRAAVYHAGLSPEQRSRVSEAFADKKLDVIAATNAFGMGIDRSDIRVVVHLQMPASIEAYYQEVGRAGRDGQPAHGLLLSGAADLGTRRRLIELGRDGATVDPVEVKRQWALFLELCRYVEAGSCRHDFILRYFGDEEELLGGCGHCDVCAELEESEGKEKESEAGSELVVQKALAGVARAKRSAGMGAIAASLAGESKGAAARLSRLSTHGLLKDLGRERALALLRRLVTAGLVELTAGDYPMAYLTTRGISVMQGKEPARVLLPKAKRERIQRIRERSAGAGAAYGSDTNEKRDSLRASLSPSEHARVEKLRAERIAIAKDVGMPAYVICHDKTLAEIAKARPATLRALGQVKGMGPARVEAYGDRFLTALER